ncbi:class I SAM-dependent methyltransferase [Capnocytophaga catalasegens]|uniref:THUMP-like domain-containing protein n=1 Tax=Capnocytophaga catalasegens TaxID=1004260 RepID=A0AAV5AZ86_9FLAO|nr:class I SAM-dependent methyltransferase [Capnocytophaga catalasegens]GIZ15583.1 hypothetical protein RCZ03_15830 [Capnocytophaga catalasegens]GJM50182.1 hypothetical protein RCZ15_11560 [Capnocytophaga catalasegens]GJM52055.1 hypothetical protein RCZ16_03730 [Capnocytophaga catalasegens]
MNTLLLQLEVQAFIEEHLAKDITKLLLGKSLFEGVSLSELATQIIGKNKCKNKLPKWFSTKGIYFPDKLAIEQSSSQQVARYKSTLVQGNVLDMTGGFGVDTYYFAKQCNSVIHCELQQDLSQIAAHNFGVFKQKNIQCIAQDAFVFLANNKLKFDIIYLDPARRDLDKNKVFFLKDCIPNVPDNLDFLWQFTDTILLKTSPMLDIQQGIRELSNVTDIHIVALNNEVKELLFLLKKDYTADIHIHAVHIHAHSTDSFHFDLNQKNMEDTEYASPEHFLYEPNAAILKSGGFGVIPQQFPVKKLAQHTHLYTSEDLVDDFQGRIFRIEKVVPFNKSLRKLVSQANITTRNFPLSVSQIRKQFKIKEGGELYLFFTTDALGQKIIIFCEKNR